MNDKLLRLGLAALLAATALPALAEKADRTKPITIEADRASLDQLQNVTVYEGNVILVQGTQRLTAARLVVTQDKAGNQFATATGAPATFRQKLDPKPGEPEQWVDGQGNRIEYDSAKSLVKIYDNGRIKRGGDLVTGNYITYDATTEQFQVSGSRAASNGQPAAEGKGRVTVVIQPKSKPEQ